MNTDSKAIEKQVTEYVKLNKIDSLLKEMINTVINENSEKPINSMINYLIDGINEEDLLRAGIIIDKTKFTKPEVRPVLKDYYFKETSTLIAKKFLTPNVFDKLKNIKTKFGGCLSHLIDIANKLEGKESVGISATDSGCYSLMKPLFAPALEFLHSYSAEKALFSNNYDIGLSDMTFTDKLFNSFIIRVNRNLIGYPYNPHCKSQTRLAVQNKLLSYFEKTYTTGKYFNIKSDEFNALKDKFFDKELNFISAGLITDNCGIFLPDPEIIIKEEEIQEDQDNKSDNNSKQTKQKFTVKEHQDKTTFAFLINFNDHLQLISISKSFNLHMQYKETENVINSIEEQLGFDKDTTTGYLTTCPSNAGSGLKISAKLLIPKAVINGNIHVYCSRWSLRIKKLVDNESEVLSKCKLNITTECFINSFIVKILSLINYEHKLNNNNDFAIKKLTGIDSSVSFLYDHFLDQYKIVSSINNNVIDKSCLFSLYNEQFISYYNDNKTKTNPRKQFSKEITSNLEISCFKELLFTNYLALHFFKDFTNDYITQEAGINVVKYITDYAENKKSVINEIYSEAASSEKIKNINAEENIKTVFIVSRNIKELDFFNKDFSNKDTKYTNALSTDQIETILSTLKNNNFSLEESKEQSNLYFVSHNNNSNIKANMYLATETNVKDSNGDHIKLESSDYELIGEVLKKMKEKLAFKEDSLFGYMTRNVLYCGSGLRLRLEINKSGFSKAGIIDKIDTLSDKNDFVFINKIIQEESEENNKYVILSRFSFSLKQEKLVDNAESFIKELKDFNSSN